MPSFPGRARAASLITLLAAAAAPALDRVDLLVPDTGIAHLEADPYHSDKVPARWIADGDTLAASVSYRGAYSLRNLLCDPTGPRNWKLKTAKETPWRGHRVWNFNLEPHIRQELAHALYAAAGIPVTPSRHVVLHVNGKRSGLYLAFPDPDNKDWVRGQWGSAAGDLYKAATDIPGDTAFFGELTDLGDADSNYYLHYQKKLNDDGPDSLDFSRLRRFAVWLNRSGDLEFQAGLRGRFALEAFIRYLVVSNFAGHWDGYPNRGKNYWLYQNPSDSAWTLFPWDVDATFQSSTSCLDNMGPDAGLFFMSWPADYCGNPRETKRRPLLERIFAVEAWKRLYIGEYQRALGTYLARTAIDRRVDSLGSLLSEAASGTIEASDARTSLGDIRTFVARRTTRVAALLGAYPVYEGTSSIAPRTTAPPASGQGDWSDLRGRRIPSSRIEAAPPGVYLRGVERRVVF